MVEDIIFKVFEEPYKVGDLLKAGKKWFVVVSIDGPNLYSLRLATGEEFNSGILKSIQYNRIKIR